MNNNHPGTITPSIADFDFDKKPNKPLVADFDFDKRCVIPEKKSLAEALGGKLFDLPVIDKHMPFKERIDALFATHVLYESPEGKRYIPQTQGRMAVIANLNGVKIPFYQSSKGTDGKNVGKRYPFFGNKDIGCRLIKGDGGNGYDIPEIKQMMDYLDDVLPEYLIDTLLIGGERDLFSRPSFFSTTGELQRTDPTLWKQYLLHPVDAGKYMAKILNYDINSAPTESQDEGAYAFVQDRVADIKKKLKLKTDIHDMEDDFAK